MIKYVLLLILCSFCLTPVFSQEGLRPLGGRISRLEQEISERPVKNNHTASRTQAVSLQIPFIEDFSYAWRDIYPSATLWQDSTVFVNTGFPIAPPSLGVATFDGLNKHGYPYKPTVLNLTLSDTADKLTSQPINLHIVAASSRTLQVGDSVAISFYYQARGNGEAPEADDSLLLDFYKPNQQVWVNVWGVSGNNNSNTADTTFKKAFVWLTDTVKVLNNHNGIGDTAYLSDRFQFRFRNKATVSGDFDHWHVDYIYLDYNRSQINEPPFNDLTFGGMPTPYLKNYSAMPYKQYIPSEMADNLSVRIRYNGSASINMRYENRIFKLPNYNIVNHYDGGNNVLAPFTATTGYDSYPAHANPAVSYTFPTMSDITDYQVQHYVYRSDNQTSDFIVANDTLLQTQYFRNYFALDDGGAESGYYVNGVGGKMAIKIGLNVPDTLESVRIYFDPVGYGYSDTLSYRFNINIWSTDASGGPGLPVYTDTYTRSVIYANGGYKFMPEYKLGTPLPLPAGTYFVGIQQRVATGISVGFDVNFDHHNRFYYDSGSGWTQSGFHGSPMIMPIFGKLVPTGFAENLADKNKLFLIYPNPSSGQFIIAADHFENASYSLMNSLGQKLAEEKITQTEQQVNTGSLGNGVYFLLISDANNKPLQQQKIIIQH